MMFLSGAQISISHAVTLAPDDIVNWNEVHSMADCQYLASNPDTVHKVSCSLTCLIDCVRCCLPLQLYTPLLMLTIVLQ